MKLEDLQFEMVKCMKLGHKFRKGVVSNLIAQVKNAAIDKGCRDNVPESLVDEVLLKAKKTAQEMIDTCPADRIETLAEYVKQFDIIDEFAPTLATDEDDVRNLILDVVNNEIELTKANKGKIMKVVAPALKGKADMGIVNKVLGGILK